jgi:uncharacterized phage infection (PIP) family protein YhgE
MIYKGDIMEIDEIVQELKNLRKDIKDNHKETNDKMDVVKHDISDIKEQMAEIKANNKYMSESLKGTNLTVGRHEININNIKTDVEILKKSSEIMENDVNLPFHKKLLLKLKPKVIGEVFKLSIVIIGLILIIIIIFQPSLLLPLIEQIPK